MMFWQIARCFLCSGERLETYDIKLKPFNSEKQKVHFAIPASLTVGRQSRGNRNIRTRLSPHFYNVEHCTDKQHALRIYNVTIVLDKSGDSMWNLDFDLLSAARSLSSVRGLSQPEGYATYSRATRAYLHFHAKESVSPRCPFTCSSRLVWSGRMWIRPCCATSKCVTPLLARGEGLLHFRVCIVTSGLSHSKGEPSSVSYCHLLFVLPRLRKEVVMGSL